MKNLLILFFMMTWAVGSKAQDTTYARKVMMRLGSPAFSGRGYINHGIDSAAEFIKNEYERIGLKPLGDDYNQPFTIEVNNISKTLLTFDSDTLIAGLEYIVDAHTKGVSGSYPIMLVNEKLRLNKKKYHKSKSKARGHVVLLAAHEAPDKESVGWYRDIMFSNDMDAAGYILMDSTGFNYSVALYHGLVNYFSIRLHPSTFSHEVPEQVTCEIKTAYEKKYPVRNVAAYLQGQEYPDSFIVITAHYDHIGMMGDALFPGGNDNASGVAMMLDLAAFLKQQNFRPRYSMVFLALASEEAGLLGSQFFADHPMIDLDNIRFLLNLDMVGTGSTGITVVNGTKFPAEFNLLKKLNQDSAFIAGVKERGEACNSDHCPFYKKGVPSFFIYTTGKEYLEYHTIGDKPQDVPLTSYSGLFRLLTAFIYSL